MTVAYVPDEIFTVKIKHTARCFGHDMMYLHSYNELKDETRPLIFLVNKSSDTEGIELSDLRIQPDAIYVLGQDYPEIPFYQQIQGINGKTVFIETGGMVLHAISALAIVLRQHQMGVLVSA